MAAYPQSRKTLVVAIHPAQLSSLSPPCKRGTGGPPVLPMLSHAEPGLRAAADAVPDRTFTHGQAARAPLKTRVIDIKITGTSPTPIDQNANKAKNHLQQSPTPMEEAISQNGDQSQDTICCCISDVPQFSSSGSTRRNTR